MEATEDSRVVDLLTKVGKRCDVPEGPALRMVLTTGSRFLTVAGPEERIDGLRGYDLGIEFAEDRKASCEGIS
jgi:hypothetical protein